jgi:YggT family protein
VQIVGDILYTAVWLFIGFMLARLVVDWVQVFARDWTPRGPLLVVLEVIYTVTDPPIMFVRRFVPPLRIGSVAVDVAFLIVFIFAVVVRQLIVLIFPL